MWMREKTMEARFILVALLIPNHGGNAQGYDDGSYHQYYQYGSGGPTANQMGEGTSAPAPPNTGAPTKANSFPPTAAVATDAAATTITTTTTTVTAIKSTTARTETATNLNDKQKISVLRNLLGLQQNGLGQQGPDNEQGNVNGAPKYNTRNLGGQEPVEEGSGFGENDPALGEPYGGPREENGKDSSNQGAGSRGAQQAKQTTQQSQAKETRKSGKGSSNNPALGGSSGEESYHIGSKQVSEQQRSTKKSFSKHGKSRRTPKGSYGDSEVNKNSQEQVDGSRNERNQQASEQESDKERSSKGGKFRKTTKSSSSKAYENQEVKDTEQEQVSSSSSGRSKQVTELRNTRKSGKGGKFGGTTTAESSTTRALGGPQQAPSNHPQDESKPGLKQKIQGHETERQESISTLMKNTETHVKEEQTRQESSKRTRKSRTSKGQSSSRHRRISQETSKGIEQESTSKSVDQTTSKPVEEEPSKPGKQVSSKSSKSSTSKTSLTRTTKKRSNKKSTHHNVAQEPSEEDSQSNSKQKPISAKQSASKTSSMINESDSTVVQKQSSNSKSTQRRKQQGHTEATYDEDKSAEMNVVAKANKGQNENEISSWERDSKSKTSGSTSKIGKKKMQEENKELKTSLSQESGHSNKQKGAKGTQESLQESFKESRHGSAKRKRQGKGQRPLEKNKKERQERKLKIGNEAHFKSTRDSNDTEHAISPKQLTSEPSVPEETSTLSGIESPAEPSRGKRGLGSLKRAHLLNKVQEAQEGQTLRKAGGSVAGKAESRDLLRKMKVQKGIEGDQGLRKTKTSLPKNGGFESDSEMEADLGSGMKPKGRTSHLKGLLSKTKENERREDSKSRFTGKTTTEKDDPLDKVGLLETRLELCLKKEGGSPCNIYNQ